MSLKATFEHILHIESFRNIDLLQQGLYYMRFYLTLEKVGKIDYSQPYNYIEGNKLQHQQNFNKKYTNTCFGNKDNHTWAPPQILDDICAYQTKTFMIRYQDEEVDLNETCFFKFEVPAYPDYDSNIFTLYCELMCADIQKIGGPPSEEDSDQLFKAVAVYKSKIHNSHQCIHEFVPILFDNHHFCIINCTFHSVLLNFKFVLQDQYQRQNSKGKLASAIMIQPRSFIELLYKATSRFNHRESLRFFEYYAGSLKRQCHKLEQFCDQFAKNMKIAWASQIQIPEHSYTEILNINTLSDTQYQKQKQFTITQILDLKKSADQQKFSEFIEKDFLNFASVLFQLNNELIQLITQNPKNLRIFLQEKYLASFKDKWGETYFREIVESEQFNLPLQIQQKAQQQIASHQSISVDLRRKLAIHNEPMFDVEDIDMFPHPSLRPVLFEEVTKRSVPALCRQGFTQQSQSTLKLPHIIVLVHGFQGNSYDLRLIKDNLTLFNSDALYLCSRANEEQTDGNIAEMGRNLASEVQHFVNENTSNQNFKLSFIGHSMGGIIIRAALPHLTKFKDFMQTYVSLSSPHLGYIYNSSTIIDAGLWLLKQMRKSLSLQQLSMSDHERTEDTFLYKLAKQNGLNWFQNIVFVSSLQDNYVPYESARVMRTTESNQDPMYKIFVIKYSQRKGRRYNQMVDQLLSSLRAEQIIRIDVNFVLDEATIDNFIGRTAHIMFLENNAFLKSFVCCQQQLFQ